MPDNRLACKITQNLIFMIANNTQNLDIPIQMATLTFIEKCIGQSNKQDTKYYEINCSNQHTQKLRITQGIIECAIDELKHSSKYRFVHVFFYRKGELFPFSLVTDHRRSIRIRGLHLLDHLDETRNRIYEGINFMVHQDGNFMMRYRRYSD
jgi:hypothetical protein